MPRSVAPTPAKSQNKPACAVCNGAGVVLSPVGAYAQATVCECQLHCEVCQDSRVILQRDQLGREYARPCECATLRQRVKLYNQAQVPAKFINARLSDDQRDKDNQQVFNALRLWTQKYVRHQKGLVLMGPPGVGKTHLLAGAIHELIFAHGAAVMFQDFFDLLRQLRGAYSRGEPEDAILNPLVNVEVLAIDEMGKGRGSEWEQNILDVLISLRYNNSNTTLVTTNYTTSKKTTLTERVRSKDRSTEEQHFADTLQDRVGERIYSRLREMCDFVDLNGRDRREFDPDQG